MAIRRTALAFTLAGGLALTLAGCVGESMPIPTYTPTSTVSPTPSVPATPTVPQFHPGGTAAANQQYFDYVNQGWSATYGMSDGRSIVDNLVAAGFTKADMEVTDDTTAINIPVDAIQVAVRIQGACLIGQFSAAGYAGIIGPMLGSGTCLVGKTITIDW
ncbi:MAG: hypothetical protein Q8M65_06975 [Rhodoglobus sp.]|nr:hypothetical protein [Rhodoglobus sp.]